MFFLLSYDGYIRRYRASNLSFALKFYSLQNTNIVDATYFVKT